MELIAAIGARRKDVVRVVVAAVAKEAVNDGFWPASQFLGKTVYRVYCRPVREAGRSNKQTSLSGKCTGLAVLKRLNSISGIPLIQFWICRLGTFQFSRGGSADIELGMLNRGKRLFYPRELIADTMPEQTIGLLPMHIGVHWT